MSRLFLATDLRLKREVVVKVLPPDLGSDASAARFKREIELTVRLQHPHILPILTSGEFEDGLFYITPYIQGESLRARIEREGKLPLDDILRILKDVSGALAFAHQRGIVHRDIKPGNILLSDGQAILADFGIARAVSTTATPLTDSGVAPGTPAYMAPELPTDEKADVYALGIVACEMLTGHLPTREATAKRILAERGSVRGDSRLRLAGIARATSRALSRSAERRPASAREFWAAIEQGQSRGKQTAAVLGASALLALASVPLFRGVSPANSGADKYALFSLRAADSLTREALRAVNVRLSEWKGPIVVNAVGPANRPEPNGPQSLGAALQAAKRMGARNLIIVDATTAGDTTSLEAILYDVAGDTAVASSHIAYASTVMQRTWVMATRRLVNGLLRTESDLPWTNSADSAAPSLAAWRALDSGRAAVRRWELGPAVSAFRDAVRLDPTLAAAHLWLAATLSWGDKPSSSEVGDRAVAALNGRSRLSERDSLLAAGLAAESRGDYGVAERAFRDLVQRDSTDFPARIGLGDAEAADRIAVRTARTPTGLAFRSSFEDAARQWRSAAEMIGPSAERTIQGWLLGRLSKVLISAANRIRPGFVVGRDTLFVGAFPYLDHDTLAFAPHASADFASRRGDPTQMQVQAAVERNRNLLRNSAEDWVRRAPEEAAAFDSLASWTELSGGDAMVAGRHTSTLELLNRARELSRNSTQQLRLSVAQVRILIKDGQFESAHGKADSLVRAGALDQSRDVAGLVGIAALLGRVHDVVRLGPSAQGDHRVQLPDGSIWVPPRSVLDAIATLQAYAAFGGPRDSVVRAAQHVARLVDTFVPDSARASRIRSTVIGGAISFLDPSIKAADGLSLPAPDPLARIALSLSRGDTSTARKGLEQLRELESGKSPGNGLPVAFRLAIYWLALGDSAESRRRLDEIGTAMPALDPVFFNEITHVLSLIRSFQVRAELANARGDWVAARRDAAIVSTLWARGDTELIPVVERMNRIRMAR